MPSLRKTLLVSTATMETRMKEMSGACQSDIQQFCTGVNPSGGRVAQCLKQHESELSSTCKEARQNNLASFPTNVVGLTLCRTQSHKPSQRSLPSSAHS